MLDAGEVLSHLQCVGVTEVVLDGRREDAEGRAAVLRAGDELPAVTRRNFERTIADRKRSAFVIRPKGPATRCEELEVHAQSEDISLQIETLCARERRD